MGREGNIYDRLHSLLLYHLVCFYFLKLGDAGSQKKHLEINLATPHHVVTLVDAG